MSKLLRVVLVITFTFAWTLNARASAESNAGLSPERAGTVQEILTAAEQTVIHVPGDVASLQDAINQVPNGGVIEIAAGSYRAPSGGFKINNLSKGFTLRAASGATVVLDGGGSDPVLSSINSSQGNGGPLLFEGLTFANGQTNSDELAAGVTLSNATATFVNTVFQNNRKGESPNQTVGGGTLVKYSTAFFFNTIWQDNVSSSGAGGLGVRDSKVIVHASQFKNNVASPPNQAYQSHGGALNAAYSTVRISNTRFEGNSSLGHGGALYGISQFNTAPTDIIIANSTFINNQAMQHSVGGWNPFEGGAINIEGNASLKVHTSRFITNSAMIGGGINIFLAKVEVYNSVFQGNRTTDPATTSGFGGAISLNYHDRPDFASLTVKDTLIQGRYGSVSSVGNKNGGIGVFGLGGRPKVNIERVAFNDLDVTTNAGALGVVATDLSLQNSMVLNSDATGSSGIGGGLSIIANSLANINQLTLANNSAVLFGGGLYAQGSTLNLSASYITGNEISPGVDETFGASYGAGIFTGMDEPANVAATGQVRNNIFSENEGVAVFDDDRANGPINDTRYDGNAFYEPQLGNSVYRDTLVNGQTPDGLNALVVSRSNGTSTDKSPNGGNNGQSSRPVFGSILAVPSISLPSGAAGDGNSRTPAYIAYAWSGSGANLNGASLPSHQGVADAAQPGAYTLSVGGKQYNASVANGVQPAASFSAAPGASTTLSWALQSGTLLDAAIDQGVSIPAAASGSVQAPAVEGRVYRFYAITAEGGVVVSSGAAAAPRLDVPGSRLVLAGLNLPLVVRASVRVTNTGGGTLNWTATSETPDLIQIANAQGSTQSEDVLEFNVDVRGKSAGTYNGSIRVDGGQAGSQTVDVTVRVVNNLKQLFLPVIGR